MGAARIIDCCRLVQILCYKTKPASDILRTIVRPIFVLVQFPFSLGNVNDGTEVFRIECYREDYLKVLNLIAAPASYEIVIK
jgi:hypothetical protein